MAITSYILGFYSMILTYIFIDLLLMMKI